jgi:hypothetical protein
MQPRLLSVVSRLSAPILIASLSVSATPVLTGSQVRAFLGSKSGKLIYTKYETGLTTSIANPKDGRSLWYVDFSEETLVERKVVQNTNIEPRNPCISPDGQYLAYNNWSTGGPAAELYVCRMMENATSPVDLGQGAQPHWWINPQNQDLYLVYPGNDIEAEWHCAFPGSSSDYCCHTAGTTSLFKIVNGQGSGTRQTLISYYANAGRSVQGGWLFASSRGTGTYQINPSATSATTPLATNTFPGNNNSGLWGCNPTVSPHPTDATTQMMWLNNSSPAVHDTIYVGTPLGQLLYTIPKDNADGNTVWDTPRWSNDTNYAAAVASATLERTPYDLYLIRLSDKSQLRVVDGNYQTPYLWIDEGQSPVQRPALTPRTSASDLVRVTSQGVSIAHAGDGWLQVIDMNGRTVVRTALSQQGAVLRLRAGAYAVQVTNSRGTTRAMVAVR